MRTSRAIVTGLLMTGFPLHAAVVDTTTNTIDANDGKTSFIEALMEVPPGGSITFAIPGDGPHYIVTPSGGYPLLEKPGVLIDGYSQSGSSKNTAGFREPNNAKLKIVLDSRTDVPGQRRTVLEFPGYGLTESCVLGLMNAPAVRVQGLAFIGVAGMDSPEDARVYNIALIGASPGVKIQGCWFGLDPAMTGWTPDANGKVAGVYGARSAVANFKYDGQDSIGLVFGNDGDGVDGEAEGNICVAQRLAVHLETPAARVSGNWFNVFPDGSFLNPEMPDLFLEDGTIEAIENGDGTGMIIGTDGDGKGDANEGNVFGRVIYDTVVEFWRPAPGVTFAGNLVGVALDGTPAFTLPSSSLVQIRKNSNIVIGSDLNGENDVHEVNHIHGIGVQFINWHGSNNDAGDKAATVSLRGNELINNYGGMPLDPAATATPDRVYADVLVDPFNPGVGFDAASTTTSLKGTAPVKLDSPDVSGPFLDVYIADTFGLYQNAPQGRSYLGTFLVDGPDDQNPAPGEFTFDVTSLALTDSELGRITMTANYTLGSYPTITTSFSATRDSLTPPAAALGNFTAAPAPAAGGIDLSWTGGSLPFAVLTSTTPAGPWSTLATVSGQTWRAATDGPRRFYKVNDGAAPRGAGIPLPP